MTQKAVFFIICMLLMTPLSLATPVLQDVLHQNTQTNTSPLGPHRHVDPFSSETAQVCGFISASDTGLPLNNAYVSMDWRDNMGGWDWNSTHSNATGYYHMNVAPGSIYLYVSKNGYFSENTPWQSIDDDEILWVNFTLDPHPNETSLVQGYVFDEVTQQPLQDAWVNVHWRDDLGHEKWNGTDTNVSGYYCMNVAPGEIEFDVYKQDYFDTETDWEIIGDAEVRWKNFTLTPHPPENACIQGRVTDSETTLPISNAWVSLQWTDDEDHHLWNWTTTNATGFYQMDVAAGMVDLYFSKDGYFSEQSRDHTVREYEVLWVNQSLYPRPPETATIRGYVFDEETMLGISQADVDLRWQDDAGHTQWNSTMTNDTGYYMMNCAAGEIYLQASKHNYTWNITDWISISDFETYWHNFTLAPDNTTPCISAVTAPDYVGVHLPGDISASVSDDHLHQVNMILYDNNTITFDEKMIIWYLFDFTGENKEYGFSSYDGTYATVEQDSHSAASTCLMLSDWQQEDIVYTLGNFKKNNTASWQQIIVEYDYTEGTLKNIALPQMHPNQTLDIHYISDQIEPGVSIFRALSFIADTGQPEENKQNFTLYSIGDSNNAHLSWTALNSGVYEGFITAQDKAYHQNISFYDLTVDSEPPITIHDISGTMGNNNWYISSVDITLTATDITSKVSDTLYRIDGGSWNSYTGVVTYDIDGEHTLEFYSIDDVNNEEDIKGPASFKIDTTPPDITLTVEKQLLTTWLFSAGVEEETSGVEKVEFYLDGELLGTVTSEPYEWEWQGRGKHTVQATVYDNAGNSAVSEEKQALLHTTSTETLFYYACTFEKNSA